MSTIPESQRQEKDGYEPAESVEEAREILEGLEHGDTMLKSVVQGDGFFAGHCDEIRSYPHHDGELQVQPPLIGQCHWAPIEGLADRIHELQLPIRVVEWEDRI